LLVFTIEIKTETNNNEEKANPTIEIPITETRPVLIPQISQDVLPEIETIVKEIEKYDWDVAIMLKIVKCESSFNPKAINWDDATITGYPSMGVLQLNRPYDEKYFDYKINIAEAYDLYLKRGYQPWSCSYILGIL